MLSGARVVRIATHPDYARVRLVFICSNPSQLMLAQMGYGSRAIEAITSFYGGELLNLDDVPADMGESFEEAARVDPVCRLIKSFITALTDF
jgi:N-acetyltransferase 10